MGREFDGFYKNFGGLVGSVSGLMDKNFTQVL